MKAEQVSEQGGHSLLPSIKTEEALHLRVSEALNQLAQLLDRVLKFTELKEREQLTDGIGGIKRELASLKVRLQRDHNLQSAVRAFNRIYLQLNQLQQEISEKENAAIWNKENRRKAMNRPSKYEQAMEQVVERDNRIKLLCQEMKNTANQNCEIKQLYDEVLQQNHVLKGNLARIDAECSKSVNQNAEMHKRVLYLMNVLEDTTSRLEAMTASDNDNRVLLEKGAAQIKRLSDQLEEAEICTTRYEKLLEGKENDVGDLSKILARKESELLNKEHQLGNCLNDMKHLNMKILTLQEGIINIRQEYQLELERERSLHLREVEHIKKDAEIHLKQKIHQHDLYISSVNNDHSAELNHIKSELTRAQHELQARGQQIESLLRWEPEARQLQQQLEKAKHEINSLHITQEATKATSVYWQEECGRTKEELRSINEQLSRCEYELERKISDNAHKQTVKEIRISDLQHEIKERLREREEFTRNEEILRSQLCSLNEEKQKLLEEKNKFLAEFLTEQSLRKSCETNLKSVNTEIEQRKQQQLATEREFERLTKELVMLERRSIEGKSEADAERVARIRAQKQCTSLEATIARLKAQSKQHADEMTAVKQQLRKLENDAKDKSKECIRLEERLKEQEHRNEDSKQKECELRESLKELVERERGLRQKKQKDQFNNSQVVKDYIAQLEAVKQEYDNYRVSMEQRIVYLNSLIEKLNHNVEELDECIFENQELRQDNEAFAQRIHDMQLETRQYSQELGRLKSENNSMQLKMEQFQEENCRLQQQTIHLRERLNLIRAEQDHRVQDLLRDIECMRSQKLTEEVRQVPKEASRDAPRDAVRFNRLRVLEDIRRLINE